MKLWKSIFGLGSILFVTQLLAQEPIIRTLDSGGGLPSNIIYRVTQDNFGQIWVASDNGVSIYDGKTVRGAKIDSLNDHFFAFLQRDKYGHIWLLNISGQLFVDVDGALSSVVLPLDLAGTYIRNIEVAGDFLWLHAFDKNIPEEFFHKCKILKNGRLELTETTKMEKSVNGLFKSGSEVFFMVHGPEANNFILIPELKEGEGIEISELYRQAIKIEEDYFLGMTNLSNRLVLFNNHNTIAELQLDKKINSLQLLAGDIYLMTESGYHIITIKDDKIDLSNSYLAEYNTNSIFQCQEGIHWISTANQGILILPSTANTHYEFKNNYGRKSSVTSIVYYNNSIMVGTNNGELYAVNKNGQQYIGNLSSKISDLEVMTNKLYAGCTKGLYALNANNNFHLVLKQQVKDCTFLDEDTVFSSSSHAIWSYSLEGKVTKKMPAFFRRRGYAVAGAENGVLWIGNISGLYRYTVDQNDDSYKQTLLPYNVSDIEIINSSLVYVSTFANGVYCFRNDKLSGKLELPSDNILDLHCDGNKLAMASEKGAIVYDITEEQSLLYSSYNYLPSNNIQCVMLQGDVLWVGSDHGLSRIDLLSSEVHSEVEIYINEIVISGEEQQLRSTYKLNPKAHTIKIDFTAISFKTTEGLELVYRILGQDTSWISTPKSEIWIPGLNPGEYHIEIAVLDGSKQKGFTSITFLVDRAWYNHLLIKMLMLGLLSFIIYFITKYFMNRRMQAELDKTKAQKKIEGMKMIALQNHMNPHFISNALYSIQDLIESNNNWEASEFTAHFAHLIRRSMRYATTERISLAQEVDFLRVYLKMENMRTQNKIRVNLKLDAYLEKNKLNVKIPPLLVQPLVENSYKHGSLESMKNGELSIEFRNVEQQVICIVSDNGIGLQASKNSHYSKESTGLKAVEERLDLNAKQLDVAVSQPRMQIGNNPLSPENRGTRIELRIDYKLDDD